jgi:protein involved in polysaccharide export with SLBB domain
MVLQSSDFQSMVKIVFDNMIGEKQDVASGLQELQKIVPLADGLTVIQLFARFRNRLVNADLANITLLRDGQKIRINYLEVLGNPSLDTALQNGDVIYVPKAVEYVYVLGEVNTPAMIKYGRDATILEYIAQAGGYKETAKLAIVTVLHTGQNGGSKELIDIKEWIKSGDKPAGGEILPGDIVIVPKDSSFKFRDYVDIVNSVIPTLSYLKIIND